MADTNAGGGPGGGAGGGGGPQKKIQKKINEVFSSMADLRKEAASGAGDESSGGEEQRSAANVGGPSTLTVAGVTYTTMGHQRTRQAAAARKIVEPALRAERHRLGRIRGTPEYAMMSVAGRLPAPVPHPTDIDPAAHLLNRDPQLPASLMHAQREDAKTGTYNSFSNVDKAIVVTRFLEISQEHDSAVPLTMAVLKAEDGGSRWRGLERRTVEGWVAHYQKYMAKGEPDVALFTQPPPRLKKGPKSILPEHLDSTLAGIVRSFLEAHPSGLAIKWIAAYVRGVFQNDPRFGAYLNDAHRVGGKTFQVSVAWVWKRMRAWGLSHRKGTTAARKLPDNVDEIHELFVLRTSYLIHTMAKDRTDARVVPKALVVNCDQGKLPLFSTSKFTWAEKGVKEVPVLGMDDKRCITGVLGSKADGTLLPLQVVMTGKTDRCLPSLDAREAAEAQGFQYTYSDNHWSNQKTTQQYIEKILVPEFARTREELKLQPDFPALLVLDCWKVHISREFREWMAETHPEIQLQFVPANCTGRMQPQDLAGQREMKASLIDIGTAYVSRSVDKAMEDQRLVRDAAKQRRAQEGVEESKGDNGDGLPPIVPPKLNINLNLGALKPLLAGWHLYAWQKLERDGTALKGWQKSKLLDAWKSEWLLKAMETHAQGKLWDGGAKEYEPDIDEHGNELLEAESALEDDRSRATQSALWAEVTGQLHALHRLAEEGQDVADDRMSALEEQQRSLDPMNTMMTQDRLDAIIADLVIDVRDLVPPSVTNHASTEIPDELLQPRQAQPRVLDTGGGTGRAAHIGTRRRGGREGRGRGGGRGRGAGRARGSARVRKSQLSAADKDLVGQVWEDTRDGVRHRYQVVKVQYQRKTAKGEGGMFVGYYVQLPCAGLAAKTTEKARSQWIFKHARKATVVRVRELIGAAKALPRTYLPRTGLHSDSDMDEDECLQGHPPGSPGGKGGDEWDGGASDGDGEEGGSDYAGDGFGDSEDDEEEDYEGESDDEGYGYRGEDEWVSEEAATVVTGVDTTTGAGAEELGQSAPQIDVRTRMDGQDAGPSAAQGAAMVQVDWVQCDFCQKWRSGPKELIDQLSPDAVWTCVENSWNAPRATCDVPEERWY